MYNATQIQNHFTDYANPIFRIVEGQDFIVTRKLVDNDHEHDILEQVIEDSKPTAPENNRQGKLHYLLFTPFRYPPLKEGGRFHTRIEQSIFYGAETLHTAMAEIAYGRFVFMQHSEAKLATMEVPHTHFVVEVASKKSVLLHRPPFDAQRQQISDPASYRYSQQLGAALRGAGVELFTYESARTFHKNRINVGLFSPEAFASNRPIAGEHWGVVVTQEKIEFSRRHWADNDTERYVFVREDFCVDGVFPAI
jgi:hypothetical protein